MLIYVREHFNTDDYRIWEYVELWSLADLTQLERINVNLPTETHHGVTRMPWSVQWSADGRVYICRSGATLRSLQLQRGLFGSKRLKTTGTMDSSTAHPRGIVWLAASPNGSHFLSIGQDYSLSVWDTATGQIPYVRDVRKVRPATVRNVTFSSDGQFYAVFFSSNVIYVCRTVDGYLMHKLEVRGESGARMLFSPDNQLFAAELTDDTVSLWRL